MEPIHFHVPAVPVAQPRPRAVKRGDHAGMAGPPTSHPIHAFRATVAMAAQQAYKGPPLDEALEALLVFVLPRPASMRWKTKPMPRVRCTARKNDWDNLGKGVCDALNRVLYEDDGCLSRVVVERWIAAGDEQPHVEVTIKSFGGKS